MKFKQYYARCYRRHFACFNLYFYRRLSQPTAICLCNTKWNSSSCYYYLHCSVINDFLYVLVFLIAPPPPLFFISVFAQKIVDPIRIIKLISKIMRLWTKSLGNHHLQVNFRQIKQNSHVCSYILEAVCWMAPYLWNKHYMHFAKYGDKHRIPAQNVNIITDSQLIGMRLYFLPFI